MNLRGNYPAKVDEKGRLKIPAVFLEQLKAFGTQFYITSPTGDTVRIYPITVWQGIEEKLSKVSSQNQAKRKFLTHTSYYGQMAEMDQQGRVLLPSILREKAKTKGEVDVFGALDYLDVMNHAKVVEDMEKNPFTDADFKALEDLGI